MSVYLDSTIAIYLVEDHSYFEPLIQQWLLANPCQLAASDLTQMEALILPSRQVNSQLLADFDIFFRTTVTSWVSITAPVWKRALQLRVRYTSLKTPDAIHLAVAIEANCSAFLTADKRLRLVSEIPIVLIQ